MLCKTDSGNTGRLVIIDHFTKFAGAILCVHNEHDAQTTSKIILNKLFVKHGTPARMQSDNATNFTAEIAQELMKATQFTKITSTPTDPKLNTPRLASSLYIAHDSRLGRAYRWSFGRLHPEMQLQGFCPICSNIGLKSRFRYRSYTLSS